MYICICFFITFVEILNSMDFRKRTIYFIFLLVVAFGTSCTELPKQITYIPKNTASVIVVDMPVVMQKSEARGAKSAKKLLAYFKSYGFSNETFDLAVHSVFSDSTETGMDMSKTIMAYLIPSREFKNAYRCMSVMLSDSAQFAAYLKTIDFHNYTLLDGAKNCVCYININDRFSWIAYNNEIAVFGCSTIHTKGITECVNDIFSKFSRNISKNDDFVDFLNEKKDVAMWLSTSEMMNYYMLWYPELPKIFTLQSIPESALKGNYIHCNVDFDTTVNVALSCTPSRAFKRYWKKNNFTTKSFNTALCDVLPQNTLWFSTLSVDPLRLLAQLKGSEYCEYAEGELAKLNLTVEDFANSFTGDCVFSMYDITLEKVRMMEFVQKYEYKGGGLVWKHLQKEQKTTFPHLAIALGLNDSNIPLGVLNHISSEICVKLQPGLFDFSKIMGFPAYVACKDNVFVFATDNEYARNVLDGKATVSSSMGQTVNQLVKKANGYASYQYMDFTVKNYPTTAKNFLTEMDALPLLESYSSIVKSSEIKLNDSYSGTVVVSFQDTTRNSLLQLNDLMEIVLPEQE